MGTEPNRRNVLGLALSAAGLAALGACSGNPEPDASTGSSSPAPTASNPSSSPASTTTAPPVVEESPPATEVPSPKPQWSLNDPNSLTVIVNKQRPLTPASFEPADLLSPSIASGSGRRELLRAPAAEALNQLAAAAKGAGTPFIILSSYRSYATQVSTYNYWVSSQGKDQADLVSARPGFSEHQTGLAVDIGDSGACNLRSCFADQPAGQWVKDNCHRFGFVVRYQPGMRGITGYVAEPWHLRFLGAELATEVFKSGKKSLEDYFGLAAAPDYL